MRLSFFQIIFLLILFCILFFPNSLSLANISKSISLLSKKLKKHNTTRK